MSEVMEEPVASAVPKAQRKAKVLLVKAPQREILRSLNSVVGIVDRRHTLPILANVLFKKVGESLEFTTSDLELQLRAHSTLGAGSSEVSTTIAARKLVDILRSMPEDQTISLTLDNDKLIVTGGKSRFTVQTLPADEFPLVVDATDYGAPITMTQKALRTLIGKTQYAMAVADIRFFLNGMLLETGGGAVRAVATDGHRLATTKIAVDDAGEGKSVIIPRKAVLELHRLLKDDDSEVAISVASSQASFTFSGLRFTTKLVEGKFPDYRRVIPAKSTHAVTFERSMLLDSLQRAELLSNEKFRGVELVFTTETLVLQVNNGEEAAREEIGIDYSGPELRVGFNVKYLIEALQNIDCDTVTLGLRTEADSCLVSHGGDEEFRGVVMPMRI